MDAKEANPEQISIKRARWARAVKILADEGFTYVYRIEELGKNRREEWVRIAIPSRTIQAWRSSDRSVRIRKGEHRRFFLFSTFIPGSAHPSLRAEQRGFFEDLGSNEFSAKGQVVRVVEEWAVVDCGFCLICELVPEYFLHEEHQTITREWEVGETVLETGILKIHFV